MALADNKVVVVHWLDTYSSTTWKSKETANAFVHPVTIKSVGILVYKDKHKIVIASHSDHFDDGRYGSLTAIPMGCVTVIKEIEADA